MPRSLQNGERGHRVEHRECGLWGGDGAPGEPEVGRGTLGAHAHHQPGNSGKANTAVSAVVRSCLLVRPATVVMIHGVSFPGRERKQGSESLGWEQILTEP